MKKTNRRGFFKQVALVAGAVATRKILPEKEIVIETDGIDVEDIWRDRIKSLQSVYNENGFTGATFCHVVEMPDYHNRKS
jgi:hypothetical protein